MKVAKLSTGKVVLFLKPAQRVLFSPFEYVLISDLITTNPRRINPYWVISTIVVWVLDFGETK